MNTAENQLQGATAVASSAVLGHPGRLDILTAKINGGERLTMSERLERQGIIFGHAGRMSSRNDHWKNPMAADRRKANQETSARWPNDQELSHRRLATRTAQRN